ncbi:glycosyltransferase [Thalassotalea sp. HSM 43]|uniref:glycosyltransferase n=1 Tax=Thalassotalea sp. HSM 43 TaxID=2552945 RepID=UPI001E320457|nr:glycosyltransferase [Thalassotalea sp. HSM 43]
MILTKDTVYHLAPAVGVKGGGISDVVMNLCNEQSSEYALVNVYGGDKNLKNGNFCYQQLTLVKMMFLLLTILKSQDKHHVIHVHGAWSFQFIYLRFILSFLNILNCTTIVFQGHGLLDELRVNTKSKYLKILAWNLYQKAILNLSDWIIVTSKTELEGITWCKLKKHKIKEITLGIGNEFFSKLETIKTKSSALLYMSQIIPIKGLDVLIRAIYKLKNKNIIINLDIYGYGPDSYLKELKELTSALDLSEQIRFLGEVEKMNRVSTLDSYKTFILPSRNESFGLVVPEALSRGCKVLTTTGTPWNMKPYTEYIDIFECDVSSVVMFLENYMATDCSLTFEHQCKQQDFIKSVFNWKEISIKLRRLYVN